MWKTGIPLVLFVLSLSLAVPGLASQRGGGKDKVDKTQHVFDDSPVNAVRSDGSDGSDGGGAYLDLEEGGTDCVSSATGNGGLSMLRTIAAIDLCEFEPRMRWRVLRMDGEALGNFDADQDGDHLETTEDVPARLLISSPFHSNPDAEGVMIWVLEVFHPGHDPDDPVKANHDNDTVNRHSVSRIAILQYKQPGSVAPVGEGDRHRTITMSSGFGGADAYLCMLTDQDETKGKKGRAGNPCEWGDPVDEVTLPFSVTITPVP